MMIGYSTLPAHNLHMFQAKSANFRYQMCPLNRSQILPRPPASSFTVNSAYTTNSTDLTRLHLSNLEKLLQKQTPVELCSKHESELIEDRNEFDSEENKGKNLLETLNLARFWPEMKAVEEMSPRHLNRLQRLLSKTEEYSPRNQFGSRWRDYHGRNDWKGMLDPLDENLRREVVRYGEFVQAAYHAFHSNPATSTEEPPLPRHVLLPDRSYKVTKNLYATSSIGLPKWVDNVAPDLGWMTQRTSWIGYVAVCDDRREIQRMGRRDIVIALRGTATCLEWAENMRANMVKIPSEDNPTHGHGQPKVENGFLSLYKTQGAQAASLAETIIEEIQRLIEMYKGESLSITVTGHSLGAALALLVADEISTCAPRVPPVAVFSFGGPRVGNKAYAKRLNANNVKVLRIVNSQDVITRVPCNFMSEEWDQTLRNSKVGGVLDLDMPLSYSHVGAELRVDSKNSPYLKPNADVSCCHDLEAYLHLVDGYLASTCPFRSNAKRSLVRLLQDQRPNVKKLYTSKATSLRLNLERENSNCLPRTSNGIN